MSVELARSGLPAVLAPFFESDDEEDEEEEKIVVKKTFVSYTVIYMAVFCLFLQSMCLLVQGWRYNAAGMQGYTESRTYGLIGVSGKTFMSHYQNYDQACFYHTRIAGDGQGACNMALCLYYRAKCQSFRQVMVVSYTMLVVMVTTMVATFAGLFFVLRHDSFFLGWARRMWALAFCLFIPGLVIFNLQIDSAFAEINKHGMYPTPVFYVNTYCAMIVCAVLGANMILTSNLLSFVKQIENPEESDEDEDCAVPPRPQAPIQGPAAGSHPPMPTAVPQY
mmetsp:Transcript_6269/g.13546  ORF Transcript_6269/g.13546 Transcript_6269/m.13546 type:complete len:279 (-) Transcript_6269:97-933(-)|eukprot:CAMPEP_0204256514 /NCGR_PEP_ID=MMETSP0468-20130131/3833_1 /ASSEMBLY_ACC=CAM_ASM_000383 /TAXON_ID=2969 /ORGANISM="Oxyrrhis marina" /LENGTH=278 /DNA_ID=CAMNT_0051230483 /DNA_START=49 /DNA_END=885 /DNA_ORIENTATION=-